MAEMARMFLGRNRSTPVTAFERFGVAVTAGYAGERAITEIEESVGLKIGYPGTEGNVYSVGALRRVYNRYGAETLERVLRMLRDAYNNSPAAGAVRETPKESRGNRDTCSQESLFRVRNGPDVRHFLNLPDIDYSPGGRWSFFATRFPGTMCVRLLLHGSPHAAMRHRTLGETRSRPCTRVTNRIRNLRGVIGGPQMVATPAESPRPDHPVRGRCLDGGVEGRRVTGRVRWLIRRLREDASDAPRIVDAARDPGQPFSAGGDAENLARLVAGAGAPNPGAGSGISLHGELRLMLRAGLSSAAAPAAATSTPAGIFGIDERWRIGESRSADLVLVDDYLAGRSLSDRETYLQVDPSGGRPGAGCRVPTHRHDHEVGHCTGLPGRQSAGRRHRRGTAETPHAGRTHATSTAPPPISPHRRLLTGEFRHEVNGSSLRTFTNWAARHWTDRRICILSVWTSSFPCMPFAGQPIHLTAAQRHDLAEIRGIAVSKAHVDLRLNIRARAQKNMPVSECDPTSRETVSQAREVDLVRERAGGEMQRRGLGHASRVYCNVSRIWFQFRHRASTALDTAATKAFRIATSAATWLTDWPTSASRSSQCCSAAANRIFLTCFISSASTLQGRSVNYSASPQRTGPGASPARGP